LSRKILNKGEINLAILKILTLEDPRLRQKAKPIAKITKRHRLLARDMLATMYDAKNGVGLAAPQIGVPERIVVIDIGKGPLILFNPKVTNKEGKNKEVESCLSVPDRNEYVTRADKVSVLYMNLEGKTVKIDGTGVLARVLQHEIDHLDGVLFIDYLNKGVKNC
jgi:peptide deformylase